MTSTPSGSVFAKRFDALEGWRGIACLMVLVYHCGVNIRKPPLAVFGFCGVHLFFVLSGYLLFRPYATAIVSGKAAPDTRNFYLRRMLRIVPPYLVSLTLFFCIRLAGHANVPTIWNMVAHASLLFNYDPRIDFFSINPVLWSLAIEVQFYLLLPIVSLIVMRKLKRKRESSVLAVCVGVIFLLGLSARFFHFLDKYYGAIANADQIRFRSIFAYLDLFAFGMAVAALQIGGSPRLAEFWVKRPLRICMVAVGLLLFFLANDWCAVATQGSWQSTGPEVFVVCFPVALCAGLALLLFCIVTDEKGGPRWMRWNGLKWLGEISFSLYLYHAGVLFFIFKLNLFRSMGFNSMTIGDATVALIPAMAVAAAMFYLVERPSLRLVARFRDRQRPYDAAAIDPLAASGTPAAVDFHPVKLLAP